MLSCPGGSSPFNGWGRIHGWYRDHQGGRLDTIVALRKLRRQLYFTSNRGSLALASNPVFHQRTKHIDIRQKFMTEMVNAGVITIEYVPTQHIFADGLTKPLPKVTYWTHCKHMGLLLTRTDNKSTSMDDIGNTAHMANSAWWITTSCKWKFTCEHCGNNWYDLMWLY